MSGPLWALLLSGVATGLGGGFVYRRGQALRDAGLTLAREVSTIENQLASPPAEVIAEVRRGWLLADRGSRLMRRGTLVSAVGWSLVVVEIALHLAGVES